MPLPAWISRIEGRTNSFVVDPHVFYPAILAELGVTEITQYWLEVAQGAMKLDFDLALSREKSAVMPGRNIERLIRSDDGRKAKWNLSLYPIGEIDWSTLDLRGRSREIRKHYIRIRGFIPAV